MGHELTDAEIARARSWARLVIARRWPWKTDADDAEQYALIKLWRSAAAYDASKGMAWDSYVCMVVSAGVSEYMARADTRRARLTHQLDADADDAAYVGHATTTDPIADVEAHWQLDLILEAAQIPHDRRAMYYALIAGATQPDAAEITGVGLSALEQRLYRERPKIIAAMIE